MSDLKIGDDVRVYRKFKRDARATVLDIERLEDAPRISERVLVKLDGVQGWVPVHHVVKWERDPEPTAFLAPVTPITRKTPTHGEYVALGANGAHAVFIREHASIENLSIVELMTPRHNAPHDTDARTHFALSVHIAVPTDILVVVP